MMGSYRTSIDMTRADTIDLQHVLHAETQQTLPDFRDMSLTLAPSEQFSFTSFSQIVEVTVVSPNRSAVDVELTKAGPATFQFQIDDVVVLRGADLTGFKIINPSSTSDVEVRVLVGGY